jgi:nicotinate phosphoribosyltransferase
LLPVMRAGRLLEPLPPLQQNRAHTQSQIAGLPRSLQTLQAAQPYPVEVSESLWDLARRTDERQRSRAELDRMQWGIEAG